LKNSGMMASIISLGCFWALGAVQAQEPVSSNIPEDVRIMLEQSQGGNQYEQMARMQVGVQYGEFLDTLEGNAQRRRDVEDAFVRVLSERADMSSRTVLGQASPAELEAISSYTYMRSNLAPLLDARELLALDELQGGTPEQQLRRTYSEQLQRYAASLTDASRNRVLEIVVNHMVFDETESSARTRLSAGELINQQLISLREAREEIQEVLDGTELQEANAFLDQLRSNLFLNQSMPDQ